MSSLLEYDTQKTLHIRSKKVGLIFRSLQLGILGYVVGYAIVYQKGYQETDTAVSSIITKVKGTAATCTTNIPLDQCTDAEVRVWDTADYVIPAQESNAVFIVSNSVETAKQTQQAAGWDEDPDAKTEGSQKVWACTDDSDCVRYSPSRNGVLSGECNTILGLCRILGWGPIELSAADREAAVPGFHRQMPSDFTLFIKNNIFFPTFKYTFSNVGLGNASSAYQTSCLWDRYDNKYCPVFRIRDILADAGVASFEDDAMINGAVVTIDIRYDCNLDTKQPCTPEFTFTRIDNPNEPLAAGYNFRHAFYDISGDEVVRTLYKVYGIRFVFVVSGTAGRFSFVPLLIAFGSGIGLLSVATVVADFSVTNLLSKRKFYSKHKYEIIDDSQALSEYLESEGSPAKPKVRKCHLM